MAAKNVATPRKNIEQPLKEKIIWTSFIFGIRQGSYALEPPVVGANSDRQGGYQAEGTDNRSQHRSLGFAQFQRFNGVVIKRDVGDIQYQVEKSHAEGEAE